MPFSAGYAYHASQFAEARIAARVGLALAGFELLGLVSLMIASLLA